ncbi:integrase family protein [Acinetobacter rudis]|uniref:integrase family protein n=1 Tax=Acinetobacter rudis TaxID=632955 RepID=UPI00280C5F07|nr:integrase family protein [Acinetobacter rudis]MDQ8951924.1 integrase family protein [Acinetobacter rudis]
MSVERFKLTKTFVDNLDFSPEKQVFYKDAELVGFALRVTKVKSYIVEKKLPGGVTCRVTIGQHGVWTVAQAREAAREYLLMISKGINPNTIKKEKSNDIKNNIALNKQIPTLREAYDFYKSKKKLSEASLVAYELCVSKYFNDWEDTKLSDITKKMVQDKFYELSEHSQSRANIAIKFLHAVFNFCSDNYLGDNDQKVLTSENPAKIITETKSLNKIKRRRNYIRSDQQHDWSFHVTTTHWEGQQNDNKHAYTNQDYLILIALTGFRREEAERIEWANVDLKYGAITVTDTKNGEDLTLPVGEVLWNILKSRKLRSEGSKYVFPGKFADTHIVDRRIAREKIIEKSGIQFTFHDLRRTFSTIANSLAIGSYTIKRLINHTMDDNNHDVTDAYVQVSFDDLRKAMNLIENVVLSEDAKSLIKNRIYFEKGKRRNFEEDWSANIEKVCQLNG